MPQQVTLRLVGLLTIATLLIGSAPPAAAAAGQGQGQRGGRFTPSTSSFIQFDQALASDGPSFEVMSNIHAYLFRVQDFGDPFPDLAESWEWLDPTTVIFHLRPGARFQDDNEVFPAGQAREIVADDVVYSMERWRTLPGSLITSDVRDNFVSMTALDPYTVELRVKGPSTELFSQLRGLSNLAIIPHEAIEILGQDFGRRPVGAGPYKLVEYVPDDHILLKRNDNYWVPCNLDEIYYKIIPDATVALLALETGDVDTVTTVPAPEVNRIVGDSRFNTYPNPSKNARMIWFPSGVKDFQDKRFRQAVAMSIDSASIGTAVYGRVAETGCGTLSTGLPGYVADLCPPFDPAAARALLAEAGWTMGANGVLQDASGQPMQPITVNTFNIASLDKVIEPVITQMRAVGIPAVAEVVEFGTWGDTYLRGAPGSQANARKLMLWAGCGSAGGVQQCWDKSAPFPQVFGYNDPEVFSLIQQANSMADVQLQDGLLQEAQRRIFGEFWTINATGPTGALQAAQSYVRDYGSRWHFDNVCTTRNNVWLDR
jgi:peptide/nickel transport system substrate-binding protein